MNTKFVAELPPEQALKPSLFSYYRSRILQPRCLLMSVLGRFYSSRWLYQFYRQTIDRYAAPSLSDSQRKSSLFPLLNLQRSCSDLEREGVAMSVDLPEESVLDIRNFADRTICYGDRQGELGFRVGDREQAESRYGRKFQQGQYVRSDLKNCLTITGLESDPVLLALAHHYMGGTPVHLTTRLFWSFALDKESYDKKMSSAHFHYDLDDYRCIRFFFYLSDVDEVSGPHVYAKGSHKVKEIFQKICKSHAVRTDEEISGFYGNEQIETITGKAGTGFAQDAMCFHKATRPNAKDRLMLQITYALNDYKIHGDL